MWCFGHPKIQLQHLSTHTARASKITKIIILCSWIPGVFSKYSHGIKLMRKLMMSVVTHPKRAQGFSSGWAPGPLGQLQASIPTMIHSTARGSLTTNMLVSCSQYTESYQSCWYSLRTRYDCILHLATLDRDQICIRLNPTVI